MLFTVKLSKFRKERLQRTVRLRRCAVLPERRARWGMHCILTPSREFIPCHRVVNRFGALAPSFAFGGKEVQKALLEKESVEVNDDFIVNLEKFQWHP